MDRRRWGLAAVIVAMVLAFALGIYGISSSTRTFRTAYTAAQPIDPGATLTAGDVRQIRIASGDPYSFSTSNPVGKRASHLMAAGHLLDDSDFLKDSGVEVPITLENVSDLHANDRVDIGAVVGDNKLVLVGRGVTMTSPSLVRVPAQDELYWLQLAATGTKLVAARSGPGGPPAFAAAAVLTPTDALAALAAHAAKSADAGPAPSPRP